LTSRFDILPVDPTLVGGMRRKPSWLSTKNVICRFMLGSAIEEYVLKVSLDVQPGEYKYYNLMQGVLVF